MAKAKQLTKKSHHTTLALTKKKVILIN